MKRIVLLKQGGLLLLLLVCAITSLVTACASAGDGASNETAARVSAAQSGDCPAIPGNEIKNPGFESGPADWYLASGDEPGNFTVSIPAHECTFAARIYFKNRSDSAQLLQRSFPLRPNTDYQFSFAAYSSSGHDLGVVLESGDRSVNYGMDIVADLTPSWQRFTVPFSTGSSIFDPLLRFDFANRAKVDDVYWIDDVRLVPVEIRECPSDSANVLGNPGFEGGNAGWHMQSAEGAGDFTISSQAYECDLAARLVFNSDEGGRLLYRSGIVLQPNSDYVLSFAAYSNTGRGFGVSLEKDNFSTNFGFNQEADLTSSWQRFTFPFSTGDEVSNAQLRFEFLGRGEAGDVYWIDDVSIVPAGE